MTLPKTIALCAILLPGLAGCLESQRHLSSDFGAAVRQDAVAQIADPDARYKGDPAPGSDGARVGLAQERYRTGKVTAPSATSTKVAPMLAPPSGP